MQQEHLTKPTCSDTLQKKHRTVWMSCERQQGFFMMTRLTGRVWPLIVSASLLACNSAAFWSGVAQGASQSASASSGAKIMVFGGRGHETYLGCLSCSQYEADSLFNQYGSYGSAYGATSIMNHYTEYGSSFSIYSACNPLATDPPVMVDGNGKYYGRLTVGNRRDGPSPEIKTWLAKVCE
jgi:hypothetical protein